MTPLLAAEEIAGAHSSHKNTNVTVTNSDLEPFSLNDKTEPKEGRPTFYSDQNASVDINENGEPNLNTRF